MSEQIQTASLDSLMPPEMAGKAESVGVSKANLSTVVTLALAVLAGAFIGLGAVFATTVATGAGGVVPFGATRLLVGLVFCLGLVLVIVGGAELFTGNNLIVMAWASHKISSARLLRNWGLVYLGNLAGAVATALIVFLGMQHTLADGAVGATALGIAEAKCRLAFGPAVALGVMCNALVCLAVWLCLSARTTGDKILSIVFPISAFVAAGFEHCVANMYFVPAGLFIKEWADPAFWSAIGKTAAEFADLSWASFFLHNLIPVTLGNVIGGGVMVGLVYWAIYLRGRR